MNADFNWDPKDWCPYIWYPQGAGGMWINYLLWCNSKQTTLPENFTSFEFGPIHEKYPEYFSALLFSPHNATQEEANNSRIRLGGSNWFNYYLNIVAKKAEGNYYGCAESVLKVLNNNVQPNLYWQDIINNPEKFLTDLGNLMGYRIRYNEVTQQAIKQYLDSCSFPVLNGEFCSTELYTEWARAVRDVQGIQNEAIYGFTIDNYSR